jgi:hypothetical protein
VETKTDGTSTQRMATGRVPVAQRGAATANAPVSDRPVVPPARGTYVADSFTGDIAATMGGTFALAHDGEPAGLARVTMAMRTPVRKESPAPRRLVGLALWAAALGILGVILAIRDAIGVLVGAPSYFLPLITVIGVVGVALTMGAFLTARARIVPWTLLGLATCALGGALIATLNAL